LNGLPHAGAKATEAAASEATEAATAATASSPPTLLARAAQLGEKGPLPGRGEF